MDRFSAYLLVRRHLKRSGSRNQALAVEAIMEEVAAHLEQPSPPWGVLGLLSQLDLEYAEQNPEVRGRTASEQALLDGLPEADARRLVRCFSPLQAHRDDETLEQVELALLGSTLIAEEALGHDRERPAESLAHDLELLRQRGDPRGNALDRALTELQLTAGEAAEKATVALQRIAQDLR